MRGHFYSVVRMRIPGRLTSQPFWITAPKDMVVERLYGEHDGELLYLSSIRRMWTHFKSTKVSLLFNRLVLAASEVWLWLVHANTRRYRVGAY